MNLKINNEKRRPGYFKLNNSLLEGEYNTKIQKAIKDAQELNKEANPSVLWSLIKGTIRNETIAFSCRKRKNEEETLKKLEREINDLEQRIIQLNNNNNNNNILIIIIIIIMKKSTLK